MSDLSLEVLKTNGGRRTADDERRTTNGGRRTSDGGF
jgi:hypothetical protein